MTRCRALINGGLRLVATVTCLAGTAGIAAAQSTVHLAFPAPSSCVSACSGQVLSVDLDAGGPPRVNVLPAALGLQFGSLHATSDGSLLLWTGAPSLGFAPGLSLLDLVGGVALPEVVTPLYEFLAHPSRLEVYAADRQGPFALSPAGVRRFDDFVCSTPLAARTGHISADGRRASFWCSQAAAVYDTATGALVRAFPQPGTTALSADGLSLYAVGGQNVLHRYDIATGAELAQVNVGLVSGNDRLTVDPRTGEVYLLRSTIDVHDGTSLQQRRSVQVPGVHPLVLEWTFDRFRPRAYVVSNASFVADAYAVVDTAALAPVLAADLPKAGGQHGRFAVTYRPSAPLALAATVSGSQVRLTWQPATAEGTPTRYVLDAGSAAGSSDLFSGLDVGAQTGFSASGVPAGTYYVRIRAANAAGAGAPSNEVVVQVP